MKISENPTHLPTKRANSSLGSIHNFFMLLLSSRGIRRSNAMKNLLAAYLTTPCGQFPHRAAFEPIGSHARADRV
jgi:hypothetical protein